MARRGRRKRRRRLSERRRVFRLAIDLYEDGDNPDDIRDKVAEALIDEGVGDRLSFFLKLLELLLPLILSFFGRNT